MPEKRVFRPRERTSGIRDARLIIIAAEGQRTEKIYFLDLISPSYRYNPKVHVEILDRLTSASSPDHIIKLLDAFRNKYRLNKYDELWLVIDKDRWKEKVALIAKECQQKNYLLAVSNPCFEIWLLLHVKSLDEYSSQTLQEFLENKKSGSRTRLENELMSLLGSYNKNNLNTAKFLPTVDLAIERARSLDVHPDHRWPNHLGTRVYLLIDSILNN
jgi:hypothetical protein